MADRHGPKSQAVRDKAGFGMDHRRLNRSSRATDFFRSFEDANSSSNRRCHRQASRESSQSFALLPDRISDAGYFAKSLAVLTGRIPACHQSLAAAVP
jgi:hypothetical protein